MKAAVIKGSAADYLNQLYFSARAFRIYKAKLEALGCRHGWLDEWHTPASVTEEQLKQAWEDAIAEARKV